MCDMAKDCQSAVTHIGSKGYIYCAETAAKTATTAALNRLDRGS